MRSEKLIRNGVIILKLQKLQNCLFIVRVLFHCISRASLGPLEEGAMQITTIILPDQLYFINVSRITTKYIVPSLQ